MISKWKFHVLAQAAAIFLIVTQTLRLLLRLLIEYWWIDYNSAVVLLLIVLSIYFGIKSGNWWIGREFRLLQEHVQRMHGRD